MQTKRVRYVDRTRKAFHVIITAFLLLSLGFAVSTIFTDEEGFEDNKADVATWLAPDPTEEATETPLPTDTPTITYTPTATQTEVPRVTRVTATPSYTPGITVEIKATQDLGIPRIGVVSTPQQTQTVSNEEDDEPAMFAVCIGVATLLLVVFLAVLLAAALTEKDTDSNYRRRY